MAKSEGLHISFSISRILQWTETATAYYCYIGTAMFSTYPGKWFIRVLNNQFRLCINILGQLCVLQSWFSPAKPTQSAPPYCGTGFVHVLDLFCDPPPQVTEHVAQFVQSFQPPSTRNKLIILSEKRTLNNDSGYIN